MCYNIFMIFKDRVDAGQQLAKKLAEFKDKKNVVVLGLPRGGVVTSFEIAKALNLPMDIIVTRKIGAPDEPEFALGAIMKNGKGVFDDGVITAANITKDYLKKTIVQEMKEAKRRITLYRGNRAPLNLRGKTALLIDDGVATGATMRAAIMSAREKGAIKVIAAIPTIANDTVKLLKKEADELVYLDAPVFFGGVGQFYESFEQTTDDIVVDLMHKSGSPN